MTEGADASGRSRLDGPTFLLVIWSVSMSVGSQVALRHGMSSFAGESGLALFLRAAQEHWVLLGLLAFVLGALSWLIILSRIDLAVAYPLGSLNYIFVTILSAWLLHEAVPLLRWGGNLLILSGILVIAAGEWRGTTTEKNLAFGEERADSPRQGGAP